jgi:hypothetical protein
MGSQFTDWAQATGPMYMGANGIMEVVWTLISVAVCIWALSAGSKHELDAYKKVTEIKVQTTSIIPLAPMYIGPVACAQSVN